MVFRNDSRVRFNCDWKDVSWDYVGNVRTCQANNLSVVFQNEIVTSINGNTDVDSEAEALQILSTTAYYMPRGIEKFFPNLAAIQIFNSELRSITKSDLKPFRHLKALKMENNQLTLLSGNLFEENPDLRLIIFDNNNLNFVGANILTYTEDLEHASFRNCMCINDHDTGKTAIQNLKRNLRQKCKDIDQFKTAICSEDIEVRDAQISEMQQEIINLKDKRSKVEQSCDGNLNSATKNLFFASKHLESCEGSNNFTVIPDKSQRLNLTCQTLREGTCKADLKVQFSDSSIENVLLAEDEVTKLDEITKLVINYQQALFLPTNFAHKFPFLAELSVTSSGLYQINYVTFLNMTELNMLTLSNNKLHEIPVDSFQDLKNLISLDVSFNKLENLESKVFVSLSKLKKLKLDGNLLIMLNADLFVSLQNLDSLFLHNNKLKFISANVLSPLLQATNIDLTSNECINLSFPKVSVATIETAIIDKCIAPIELNCGFEDEETTLKFDLKSSNGIIHDYMCKVQDLVVDYPKTKISHISGNHISGYNVNNITSLVASDQSLKFLPFELFKTFPKLVKLLIERSKLTSIMRFDFVGMSELRYIEIRHNNVSAIGEGSFDEVLKLELLDLSHNCIQSLPSKLFFNLIDLKSLILSYNDIERFTADLLPRKNSLEIVRIDNNHLEVIETKTLRFLKKSKIVDLTANVCVDVKFDRSDNKSKSLIELSGEIDFNCSSDD